MPADLIQDGQMPYGTRILTINGTAYKVNTLSISRPTTEAEDSGIYGQPGRLRATAQRAEISITLQLATPSTVYPEFGDTISDTFDSKYGVETFWLNPPEHSETNDAGEIRTVTLTGKKVINSITKVTL